MIHELLLSLSGHPSPLFSSTSKGRAEDGPLHSLLAPAELALLQSLADNLGNKHRDTRDTASSILSTHTSIICKAVSTAIISTQLAEFQRRILEVEKDILQKSPAIVGAYNTVPLSAIVGAFNGWDRRLAWLWDLVQYMKNPRAAPSANEREASCTAADVIQWLRDASHTGYPDLAQMAVDLLRVAEMAWLKQISAWILYGRHPGAADFFIIQETIRIGEPKAVPAYSIRRDLVPGFVTQSTANSILFIGKSLNHIRERQFSILDGTSIMTAPGLALLPNHLAQLSTLQSPISSASFSATISKIRLSLSQKALQKLLPMSKVIEILHVLKDFFLLERGEFALALIAAADDRLTSRNPADRTKQKTTNDLASLTIKEGEVHTVLARTWTTLESLQSPYDDYVDDEMDRARELIRLSIKTLNTGSQASQDTQLEQRASTATFDDLLLPSSTVLRFDVPSPHDLFLTPADVEVYSRIHAYLLAIRRAHLRLSKLFLLSALRRDHPSPKSASESDYHDSMDALSQARQRANTRTRVMRPVWATIGSAAFFLAELGEYLQGEVVRSSWATFYSWLVPPITPEAKLNNSNVLSSSLYPGSSHVASRPSSSRASNDEVSCGLHDPESLSEAHRSYLTSLEHSLLYDNAPFTSLLRRLLTTIDHMHALMQQLDTVQQRLDVELENAQGASSHYGREEKTLLSDLQSSRIKVADGVQGLVDALRKIDNTRADGRTRHTAPGMAEKDFVPWFGGGVDRLLLKFDYGNVEGLIPQQFDGS